MQPLENPDDRAGERDVAYVHRTIPAAAAQTTTHAWSVPQRHAARPRRLVGHSDRHVESGIDLRYCRDASPRRREESWLLLGGLRRKGEDIN